MDSRVSRCATALLFSLIVSKTTFASTDGDSCPWGAPGCLIGSLPVLDVSNDTRDNLLRLLSEKIASPLPLQPIPADFTRSRDFYFGPHLDAWYRFTPPAEQNTVQPASAEVQELLRRLGLTDMDIDYSDEHTLENRFVSMTAQSDANFLSALLADDSLSQEQRQALAKARLFANGSKESLEHIEALDFPADSTAEQFKTYLTAANDFYAGKYDEAEPLWLSLQQSQQPWLAEASSYMLIRNALNKSSQNAAGQYGDFDVNKVDPQAAEQALKSTHAYLQHWPTGQYAASATGLLRKINWYLQDGDSLAKLYETAFSEAKDVDSLIALIAENDNKLQSRDSNWDDTFYRYSPDAPLLTFTQALRMMRNVDCNDRQPCADKAYLDEIKPVFEQSEMLNYWHYLNWMLAYQKKDYAQVISDIKPVSQLPANDILAFSEQALYGDALMAQQKWSQAREHWSQLLASTQNVEQQQYLQSQLAATLVQEGKVAEIFAGKSPITNLRYRSAVLKTRADADLLRQQVASAPNNEERTIALHTLLMRDLIEARYDSWLADKALTSHITPPVIGDSFADVNLSVFDWPGEKTEDGYFCPSLTKTVSALSKNDRDGHALNCLGEFLRTSDARISLWKDTPGNVALDAVTSDDKFIGQPSRQDYYQQVMADKKSEPEDKSYALYRAVMCYSPSGYNDCGGTAVDEHERKRWFTQLKSQYPGSVWAQKLKYYW